MIRMRLWTPISCLIFRTKLQWMDSNSKSFLSSWFDLLRMYQYSVYCVSYYCCCSQLVERWVSLLSRLVAEQLYRTVSDVQGYQSLSVHFQIKIIDRNKCIKIKFAVLKSVYNTDFGRMFKLVTEQTKSNKRHWAWFCM